MKRLFSIFLAAALLCGCTENPLPEDPGNEEESISGGGKEDTPIDHSDYTRVAVSSAVTGVQPMTGIALWNTSSHKRTNAIQLEFAYMLYSDVCKTKDIYRWAVVENLLNDIARRGHQAVLRFRYVYPGYSAAVPDYIKEWPGYEATWGKSEGEDTEFPDWRCAELQRFHKYFYNEFAHLYDKDPRLAFLETGFGLWAEYHIYDGPFVLGKTFPSKGFQADFIREMDNWFVNTPWAISIDAADDTYGPFQYEYDLLKGRFGNFDDSFMCSDHDGYNYNSWKFFGTDRYKRAPFGGEFSYYKDYDQEHCLDEAGIYGRKFEDEVAKYHMSFIIGNDQPKYQSMDRIKSASMAMGYRFKVTDFLVKEGTGAAVQIENSGVAPIYRDAFVAVDGIKGSYNLRNLMPGESVWVDILDKSIKSSSQLSIVCDHLVSGQKIEFDADVKAE